MENSYELTYKLVSDGSKEKISYQRIIPDLKNDGLLIPYRIEKRYSRAFGIGHIKFYLDEVLTDTERIQYLCDLAKQEIFPFTNEIKVEFYEEGMSEYFTKAMFKDENWEKEFKFSNSKKNYNINDYRDFSSLTLEEKFKQESNRLRGSGYIKISKLENGTAYIEYVKDYEEFKSIQPQSRITETKWNLYWSTGDAVLKAINDSVVRLMKKIDQIQEVVIKLPFEKNIFTLHAKKNEIESFLGYSFKEIRLDWDKTFSNKYVYSKQGREEFFNEFGNVKMNK